MTLLNNGSFVACEIITRDVARETMMSKTDFIYHPYTLGETVTNRQILIIFTVHDVDE